MDPLMAPVEPGEEAEEEECRGGEDSGDHDIPGTPGRGLVFGTREGRVPALHRWKIDNSRLGTPGAMDRVCVRVVRWVMDCSGPLE